MKIEDYLGKSFKADSGTVYLLSRKEGKKHITIAWGNCSEVDYNEEMVLKFFKDGTWSLIEEEKSKIIKSKTMKTAYHTFEFRGRKITTSAVQEGNTVSVGYAVCMPEDTFKNSLSRTISKGRALSKSKLESYEMDPKLKDNYGALKAIAVSWEHAIKENPEVVIKGYKK